MKKGAYGALMDDDNAGDEFCEEDIDQILQRRTQVIQIESEQKGSTFAKVCLTGFIPILVLLVKYDLAIPVIYLSKYCLFF